MQRLIFELSHVHSYNHFLLQSNAILHGQIAGLEQTIQVQDGELKNKEQKIILLQNITKLSKTSSPSTSTSSTSSTTSIPSSSKSSSQSSPSEESTSHIRDAINTVGTFVLGIGEGLQDLWNGVTTMVTAPFKTKSPQSKYVHQTTEDQKMSYTHIRSCVVNYTIHSGGIIDEHKNEVINKTAMSIMYSFTDAIISKNRATSLIISGNNKTNVDELWNCLSRMEKYGRQLRISSDVPRTEFTDEIFQEISNSQQNKLPRSIVVVDIDETQPSYNNTGEAVAYRGYLEGAIDDTMPLFVDTKHRQTRADNVFIVMLLKTNLDLNGDYEDNLLCMREYFMNQWTFRFWTRIVHQIFLPH
eukprot:TRINITY_DN731_c2_g1_i8.p1 TRINITY_DN731_c2_g1~~TRINITY_DN731_c2_g1_i8.p1  ORF type:complete len:357 (-),score=39.54 TRINITY_DN731_c2_g1_i8:284-1354(-)